MTREGDGEVGSHHRLPTTPLGTEDQHDPTTSRLEGARPLVPELSRDGEGPRTGLHEGLDIISGDDLANPRTDGLGHRLNLDTATKEDDPQSRAFQAVALCHVSRDRQRCISTDDDELLLRPLLHCCHEGLKRVDDRDTLRQCEPEALRVTTEISQDYGHGLLLTLFGSSR